MNPSNIQIQIPNWLQITKVGDEHYRVTDTSVDAVGLYLGSFQTRQAAVRFASKVSEARAEVRNRNVLRMRSVRSGMRVSEQPAHH